MLKYACLRFFFFNDTATTEIYTLSLHDALPICLEFSGKIGFPLIIRPSFTLGGSGGGLAYNREELLDILTRDRKSTRLNSSHSQISYAVFCLKKKNT